MNEIENTNLGIYSVNNSRAQHFGTKEQDQIGNQS